MAGLPVDTVIEKLTKACSDYLQDQVGWQTGMKPEMLRLQENLIKIKAVVADSSQVQITDQNQDLMAWRWQLRAVIDEADDLLDDFEYTKHKEQLIRRNMVETKNISDTTRFLLEGARKVGRRALKIDCNLKRLKEVVRKLDEVLAKVNTFLHLVENTKKEQQKQELELLNFRETGSVTKKDFVGRDEEVEKLMQWLRKASNEDPTHITRSTSYNNISLLSIVGQGGMGKTTLLRHVYEDIKDEFDLQIWVCVSPEFDPKKVIANMLGKSKPEPLDVLQRDLNSKVLGKKFLLVLDDIWEEEEEGRDAGKWEKVIGPLISGSFGSKILVTTRMDSVASMIANVIGKKKITLSLKDMKEDECLKLFETHAFAVEDNLEDHKKLRHMAREIVKKLSGSPLAAKVIGAALKDKDETDWRSVLNNDIGSAALGPNTIMPILKLSYAFLPKPLQCCFAFCSIFQQDHQFGKDDLVRMWISLGFIAAPSTPGVTMEDIGGRYFNILVKKSFFDMHKSDYSRYYKIHALLHELAQSISEHEVFRFTGIKEIPSKIPETTRHLFIHINDLGKIRKLKNLHSLFLTGGRNNQEYICEALTNFFKVSRNIRLLSILSFSCKELPEAIGNLTHLRYLNIPHVKYLPRSLSSLYHLQFMIIKHLEPKPVILPRDMNNLTNLRYVNIMRKNFSLTHPEILFQIYGIGKLKSLQEFDGFYIKDENGFRIGELEQMNSLRLLNINCLHNVRDPEETRSAKLNEKIYLKDLSLNFSERNLFTEIDLDEKVLENLQPPNNLKKFSIRSYMGSKSASWMDNAELISNFEKIELNDCFEWETLPPFEQLPFLKSLYLHNMPKVKRFIDKFCVFPSLEWLHIKALKALEGWFNDAGEPKNECLFPCLSELYLEDCPNLPELPVLSPKLEKLEIDRVGWKALNWKQGISNCCSISKSIPLKTLKVVGCPNLTSIPLADETVRLEALRYLTIRDCPNLISLGGLQEVETSENFKLILSDLIISDPSVLLMEPLRSITSIETLEITSNNKLVLFPSEAEKWFLQVSSSLTMLSIVQLESLQSLPSSLESLSSLETLKLYVLPQLQLLPNIPASLKRLFLHGLESLQCLPSSLSTLHNSSLKSLSLYKISLKSLPDLPRSLCYLDIDDLDKIDCLPSSIASLSSLQNLSITKVPQLRELPDLPRSLRELDIDDLDKIDCLPSSIASLSSLRDLSIIKVPQLRELPDLPRSLCYLYIDNLDKIDCLPSSIASLSSLQILSIIKVPQLRELPDLPPSLEYLEIRYCHPELKKRYKKPSGSDLQKFAHIPDLEIWFGDDEMEDETALTCRSLLPFLISKFCSMMMRWGRG